MVGTEFESHRWHAWRRAVALGLPTRWLAWWGRWDSAEVALAYATPDASDEPDTAVVWLVPSPPQGEGGGVRVHGRKLEVCFPGRVTSLFSWVATTLRRGARKHLPKGCGGSIEGGRLNGPLIPVEVRVSPLNLIRHVMLCSGSACHTIQYM